MDKDGAPFGVIGMVAGAALGVFCETKIMGADETILSAFGGSIVGSLVGLVAAYPVFRIAKALHLGKYE